MSNSVNLLGPIIISDTYRITDERKVIGTTRATLSSAMSIPLARLMASAHPNERGFSLLEVMVALAIITTVFAVAMPNYLIWNRTYQLRQATTDLQGSMTLARMMAMNQNATVSIAIGPIACPPNTTSCGVNGASFTRQLNGVTVAIIPSIPFANNKITAALITGGPAVQLNSLGLRISQPVTQLSAGDQNEYITIMNTDNLTYSVVITPGGKIRWCPASTCS